MTAEGPDRERSDEHSGGSSQRPTEAGQSIADHGRQQPGQGDRHQQAPHQQPGQVGQPPAQSGRTPQGPPPGQDDDGGIGRREVLIGGGIVAAAGVGGYVLLGGDDNGTSTRPDWADWIPERHVQDQAFLGKIDTDSLREEFPPGEYEDFLVAELPELFGFEHEDMDDLYVLEVGVNELVEVLTGRFDIDDIAATMDAEFTGTVDEGFEIATTPDGTEVGLREDILVFGSEARDGIAAQAGELDSIGETDEGWDELLRAVGSPPVAFCQVPPNGMAEPYDFEVLGTIFRPETTDTVEATGHYLYDSEATAESILADEQSALEDHFIDAGQGTIESVEQDGRRVIITASVDDL